MPALPPLTPVLCGPTAGGKSELAFALAAALREHHDLAAEIVSADAFQIYRGLDIGTAKPTPDERARIPHHLIDLVDPHAPTGLRTQDLGPRTEALFSAHDWLSLATRAIADIRARGSLPIVVGGTHLYIKALLDGLFEGPEPDPALRAELAAMDPAARREELERVDPQAAQRIHPNDARRTIRALEVHRLTGKPISALQTQWDQPQSRKSEVGSGKSEPVSTSDFPLPTSHFLPVLLDWDTPALNSRINARVKSMLDRGLVSEVRALLQEGDLAPQPAEALGYKQLIPVVRAALAAGSWPPPAAGLDEAAEAIKIETRRFAKNQRTWLRRLCTTPGAVSIPMPATPIAAALDRVILPLNNPPRIEGNSGVIIRQS